MAYMQENETQWNGAEMPDTRQGRGSPVKTLFYKQTAWCWKTLPTALSDSLMLYRLQLCEVGSTVFREIALCLAHPCERRLLVSTCLPCSHDAAALLEGRHMWSTSTDLEMIPKKNKRALLPRAGCHVWARTCSLHFGNPSTAQLHAQSFHPEPCTCLATEPSAPLCL